MNLLVNHPAGGNAGFTLQFAFQHRWPAWLRWALAKTSKPIKIYEAHYDTFGRSAGSVAGCLLSLRFIFVRRFRRR
jgi:hypothetical protein